MEIDLLEKLRVNCAEAMKVRNFRHEYDSYHKDPDQKKRRAKRNAARSLMVKKGRVKKGDGKDVDHKNRNLGGNLSNDPKNLRVRDRSKNRNYRAKT